MTFDELIAAREALRMERQESYKRERELDAQLKVLTAKTAYEWLIFALSSMIETPYLHLGLKFRLFLPSDHPVPPDHARGYVRDPKNIRVEFDHDGLNFTIEGSEGLSVYDVYIRSQCASGKVFDRRAAEWLFAHGVRPDNSVKDTAAGLLALVELSTGGAS